MGWAQFENELILRPEVDLLQMLAACEIPEVQSTAIARTQKHFRNQAVFKGVRRAPFAGYERVISQVPPAVVGQLLRSAVDFPAPERLEAFRIQQKNPAGRATVGVPERSDIDAAWTAVHRVRTRIAGAAGNGLRFDHLDDGRVQRVGFRIEDIDARGAQPRHDQVTPLSMRVRRVRAKAGGAGVPAEVMQFVARVRHRQIADDP